MKKLGIIGTGPWAQDARFDIENDPSYEVVAVVTTHDEVSPHSDGLPVVPLSVIDSEFPPSSHSVLVVIGFENLNRDRAAYCEDLQARGYGLVDRISPLAHTWSMRSTGPGSNCQFGPRSVVHPTAKIGKNVIVGAGAMIAHFSTIGDHCYIDAGAMINDNVTIGDYSYIGAKANLRNRLQIGQSSVIGAGALVMDNTSPNEVQIGRAGVKK